MLRGVVRGLKKLTGTRNFVKKENFCASLPWIKKGGKQRVTVVTVFSPAKKMSSMGS